MKRLQTPAPDSKMRQPVLLVSQIFVVTGFARQRAVWHAITRLVLAYHLKLRSLGLEDFYSILVLLRFILFLGIPYDFIINIVTCWFHKCAAISATPHCNSCDHAWLCVCGSEDPNCASRLQPELESPLIAHG